MFFRLHVSVLLGFQLCTCKSRCEILKFLLANLNYLCDAWVCVVHWRCHSTVARNMNSNYSHIRQILNYPGVWLAESKSRLVWTFSAVSFRSFLFQPKILIYLDRREILWQISRTFNLINTEMVIFLFAFKRISQENFFGNFISFKFFHTKIFLLMIIKFLYFYIKLYKKKLFTISFILHLFQFHNFHSFSYLFSFQPIFLNLK